MTVGSFLTPFLSQKQSSSKGFTLVELSIAMVLTLLTAFAATSIVSTAVNASISYQARQGETNAGLLLSGMIKNDLKRATAVVMDGHSSAGDAYIKMTTVTDDDLANGNEGHEVFYHITGGSIYRGTASLGAGPGSVTFDDVTPSAPAGQTLQITCTDPCGIAYDANGVDTTVSGLNPVRFVIYGLTVDVDARDRFSLLFDADNAYQLPELSFFYTSGGTLVDDTTADTAAATYVDSVDSAEAAAKEAKDEADKLAAEAAADPSDPAKAAAAAAAAAAKAAADALVLTTRT